MSTGLKIEELASQVGLPVRTIRYYINEGLLPGPGGRGKAAVYGEEQVLRLRLIRRLSEQRVPLAEQRERLARLTTNEIRDLLTEAEERTATLNGAERAGSARDYLAALLNRARAARRPPPTEAQLSGSIWSEAVPEPSSVPPVPLAQALPAEMPEPQSLARLSESAPPELLADRLPVRSRSLPGSRSESWQRWEIVPGVELQIRGDAQTRHRRLIARILRAAGLAETDLETDDHRPTNE